MVIHTVAIIWTLMTTPCVILFHFLTFSDGKASTVGLDELALASASAALALIHLPLLESAQGGILAKEDIKGRVDLSERVIPHEDNPIESVQDHAYLRSRVPSIVTSCVRMRMSVEPGLTNVMSLCDVEVSSPLGVYGASNPCRPPPFKASRRVARFLQYSIPPFVPSR